MTVAVCVNCGAIKHGAFNDCGACGIRPETETDLAYSLALTDHYFAVDTLNQISADMRQGRPRPSLPLEEEERFREAARVHLEKFGEMLGLPPPEDPAVRRRLAKFRGWPKEFHPVVSGLRWRMGFGWGAVAVLATTASVVLLTSGIIQIVAIAAAVPTLIYAAYKWRTYNARGWPQLHYRAMLAYAQVAGAEAAKAHQHNREFSTIDACRALGLLMVQGKWRNATVDAMIRGLESERGAYLASVIRKYGARALPKLESETMNIIAEKIRALDICPQLVIANIVENTFGGAEAARYAVALVTGKAR